MAYLIRILTLAGALLNCGLAGAQPAETKPIAPSAAVPTNSPAVESAEDHEADDLVTALTIFVLAIYVGFEIITKVPPTLHTPLMSGSNAVSGITVVGALVAVGTRFQFLTSILAFFAVAFAMVNVVGGFLVTHRMLGMFKRR